MSKAKNEEYVARVNDAEKALDDLRGWMEVNAKAITLNSFAERISAVGAGNCMEYSVVVLSWLRRNGKADRGNSGYVSFKGLDHAFVQLGFSVPADKKYPTNFAEWGDAWVIDPWVNICCPAQNYPLEVGEKMKKWSRENKYIDGAHGKIKPIDWGNAVNVVKKRHVDLPE
jgi:hypothetical protein